MKDYMSLRDILVIFFKYKFLILTTFFITVLTVVVGTLLLPTIYEAHSTLLLKYGREYAYQPEVGDSKGPTNYYTSVGIINVEIRILTSQDLITEVIEHIGVENLYPQLVENPSENISMLDRAILQFKDLITEVIEHIGLENFYSRLVEDPPENISNLDRAILQFKEDLTVQGITASNMVSVSFQHVNPRMTDKVVNLLVDLYKEKHLQILKNPTVSTFLEDKVISYQARLRASEEALIDFKQKNNTYSFKEQQTLYLNQRSVLDANLKDAEKQIAELEKKYATLTRQLKTIPKTAALYSDTGDNYIVDRAKEQLLQLLLKEQDLLSKYRKSNLVLTNTRKEIQVIKKFLKDHENKSARVRFGKSEVYKSIEQDLTGIKANIESQKARQTVLEQQLTQVDETLNALLFREKHLRNLQRELTKNEQNFHTYVNKFEEARISDEMDRQKMTNIRVIQVATPPLKPIKPRKTVNYIVGLLMGIILGIGLAIFMEFADQGLSTPDSAQMRLKLPVLATVSLKKQRGP